METRVKTRLRNEVAVTTFHRLGLDIIGEVDGRRPTLSKLAADKYGGITDPDELRLNLEQNCIPPAMLEGEPMAYEDFLADRRRLMAERIRVWFEGL